ncbi:MAG: anti-sigma factor domain-containing protein [Chloroflexota bacterium]
MTRELTCDEVRESAGAFVLGALDRDEADSIREHLRTCSEAHEEITELGTVLPALAESVEPMEPTTELKGRILAAAAADRTEGPTSAPAVAAAATPAERRPLPVAAAQTTPPRRWGWVLQAAAVIAIVALAGWGLLTQVQLNDAQSYARSVDAVLQAASQPGAVAAILTPAGGSQARGLAAIDPAGRVTLAARNLEATSGTEVYEAWAIGRDGKPVPVGGFRVGADGLAHLEGGGAPGGPGTIVALTREPRADPATPTLPILAQGLATAPS